MPRTITSNSNQNVDIAPNGTGLFTIKGSAVGLSSIINSTTFAGAGPANINTASSTKSYIDARGVFGNWTPAISWEKPGTFSATYAAQLGRYFRSTNSAGLNFVFVWAAISCATFTLGTASGLFRITGLPFASSTSTGMSGGTLTAFGLNFTWAGGTTLLGFASGGSTFTIWRGISSNTFTNLTQANFSASLPNINFSGFYVGQ